MKKTFSNQSKWRLAAISAVLSCAVFGAWGAGANSFTNPVGAQAGSLADRQKLQDRIRKGVGSEVRFSTAKDSEAGVMASIESVAQFIHSRSGMTMGDETKRDLQNAEMETIKGKRPRISIEALTDSLVAASAERIGMLGEKEIESVTSAFRPASDGQIVVRMAGNVANMPRGVFTELAKSVPALKQSGELENSIRPFFESQITDRSANLSGALPQQFGRITSEGVTPLQAVLIAYSVTSDDSLADSRNDLARQTVQDRMSARLSRAAAKAQRLNSPTPYGRNGSVYAAPVGVLFNRTTVQRLLNSAEGGKGK